MIDEIQKLENALHNQINRLNNVIREKDKEIEMLKYDLKYVTGVANDFLADSKINRKPNKQELF
jgi:predicted RNase H-like nuclease (RuvC/YqgF family)